MVGHLQKLWQHKKIRKSKTNKHKRRALSTRERGQPQHQQPGLSNLTGSGPKLNSLHLQWAVERSPPEPYQNCEGLTLQRYVLVFECP